MKKAIVIGVAIIAALLMLPFIGSGEEQGVRVAILTPATHPSLEAIEEGFKKGLGDGYRFKTFNAQGNQTLMRSEVREIERENFDLVFTIGAQATQMVGQAFSKIKKETPIVFAAVSRPEELQLKGEITGVKEYTNHQLQLNLLKSIEPDVRRALLVYDPTLHGMAEDAETVGQILSKEGIELQRVEVFRTNELQQKVGSQIGGADLVMILKDNTVVAGVDVIAKLCKQREISLLATDLDSVDRGATYGFGVHEADFGYEAAKKAAAIFDGMEPKQIPVTPVDGFKLKSRRKVVLDNSAVQVELHV